MTTSQQMELNGKVHMKKFGEGWSEEDWQNYYSDEFDREQAGLPDWQKRRFYP